MYADARKLSIIEAVIKTDDDATLKAIEEIVKNDNIANEVPQKRFSDLLGVLTPQEAEAMKQTIEEHFEKVNPDDWK